MKNKPLTRDQRHQIRAIWMQLWNKREIPSMEEAWYEAITDFLAYEGAQIHHEELCLLEHSVIDKGLSTEYISVLRDMIKVAYDEELGDDDKFVMLMSTTPSERIKALKFVLGV